MAIKTVRFRAFKRNPRTLHAKGSVDKFAERDSRNSDDVRYAQVMRKLPSGRYTVDLYKDGIRQTVKHAKKNPRTRQSKRNPVINGINRTWQTFAGGTWAHHGNSYAMYLENRAMFDISPPQRRGGSYNLRSFGVTAPHWVHHGSFRSPQAAKAEAKRILESDEGLQRLTGFAKNPRTLHTTRKYYKRGSSRLPIAPPVPKSAFAMFYLKPDAVQYAHALANKLHKPVAVEKFDRAWVVRRVPK